MMRDDEAPIPFERAKHFKDFKPDLVYISMYADPNDDHTKIKFEVPKFRNSEDEDCEAALNFFHDFENAMIAKELWSHQYTQATNASPVFIYFEQCLGGTAKTDWKDALVESGVNNDRTWRDWKDAASYFLTEKVLPKNAYNLQLRYLQQRFKPTEETFKEYYGRLQHISSLMPYMLTRAKMEEVSSRTVRNYQQLWQYGSLTEHQMKEIVLTKIPQHMLDDFKRSALSESEQLSRIKEYFIEEDTIERR